MDFYILRILYRLFAESMQKDKKLALRSVPFAPESLNAISFEA
jgi:hypothetical protein